MDTLALLVYLMNLQNRRPAQSYLVSVLVSSVGERVVLVAALKLFERVVRRERTGRSVGGDDSVPQLGRRPASRSARSAAASIVARRRQRT